MERIHKNTKNMKKIVANYIEGVYNVTMLRK